MSAGGDKRWNCSLVCYRLDKWVDDAVPGFPLGGSLRSTHPSLTRRLPELGSWTGTGSLLCPEEWTSWQWQQIPWLWMCDSGSHGSSTVASSSAWIETVKSVTQS